MLVDNSTFFQTLTLNISSCLEPANAWSKTFKFLTDQFPIDAISLHSFNPEMRAIQLQFLVTDNRYLELDTLLPLTDSEMRDMHVAEIGSEVINVPRCSERQVSRKHLRAVEKHLNDQKDRSYLLIVMKTEEIVVGHLCLIGNKIDCFTSEHEHKIKQMQAPVSLALMNMQRYRQTQELKRRLDKHRLQLEGEVNLLKNRSIVGARSGLHKTMRIIQQLAGKEAPTLILGETGTGKELIADAVQQISPRADKPYVTINCGAIPDTLIDSELFGHQKGAFTGALTTKIGRFEQADGGTLFLDEVGELPLKAQVRLLRVLQNGTIERVGGQKSIKVDVRIIAATNRSLENMLQQRTFREDLYYRLNVFPINLPPLRDRSEDIPLLVRHFVSDFARRMKLSEEIQLDGKCLKQLQAYSWPGNVRELRNLVERALTISPRGPLNIASYLPQDSGWYVKEENNENFLSDLIEQKIHDILQGMDLRAPTEQVIHRAREQPQTLDAVMADHIRKVVEQCNNKIGGTGGAAEKLDIHPNTLRKRMEKLNIPYGNKR